jgi:hypothetical protein
VNPSWSPSTKNPTTCPLSLTSLTKSTTSRRHAACSGWWRPVAHCVTTCITVVSGVRTSIAISALDLKRGREEKRRSGWYHSSRMLKQSVWKITDWTRIQIWLCLIKLELSCSTTCIYVQATFLNRCTIKVVVRSSDVVTLFYFIW